MKAPRSTDKLAGTFSTDSYSARHSISVLQMGKAGRDFEGYPSHVAHNNRNYLGVIEDLPKVIVQVVQRVRFGVYKVAKFLAVIDIEEDILERIFYQIIPST